MHPFTTNEIARSRTQDALARASSRREARCAHSGSGGHSTGRLQTRLGSALIGVGQRLVNG